MLLEPVQIISMFTPVNIPLVLSGEEPYRTFESKDDNEEPIVRIQYNPPFKVDEFRLAWFSAIVRSEEITFAAEDGRVFKGYVTYLNMVGGVESAKYDFAGDFVLHIGSITPTDSMMVLDVCLIEVSNA